MMIINLAKIKSISHAHADFCFREQPDALAAGYEDFELAEDLTVSGKVKNSGIGRFEVSLTYQTKVKLTCSRCGQPFLLPMNGDLTCRFALEAGESADGEEVVWPVENDNIDILLVVLNEIYFALPMQPLCREDCRGLCPMCGADLNNGSCTCEREHIDPRWEKLKDLLKEV